MVGLGLAAGLLTLGASPAHGQLFSRLKEMAARKAAAAAAERVAKATQAGSDAIDSTVDKSGRALDSAVVRSGESIRAGVRGESAGDVVQAPDSASIARMAGELSLGRLALDGLRFDGGDRLDGPSTASLHAVARAMKGTSGGYVVKVRVTATSNAQQTADRRAAAIRLVLVTDGIEAERLFSAGSGVTGAASTRAEILRLK
jgi:hypothetical protein